MIEDITQEMVRLFGISRAEAVARINKHWENQDLSWVDDIVLHEDDYYWALSIYFEDGMTDWRRDADRSLWPVRERPQVNSRYWTIQEV